MNGFDKFLKKLKTDRNTFFTYLFLLITIFILVDRLTEYLLIVFTGVAYSYFGPIKYAICFIFPIFGFAFSMSSKYITCDDDKLGWFYAYCIFLYTLVTTMVVEWINSVCWTLLLSLPNFKTIVSEYAYLIKPAFSSIALAIPICTAPTLFNFLYTDVAQSKKKMDSLFDYNGIDLSPKSNLTGKFTNEIHIGTDKDHGTPVNLCELRRFEQTLVVGISGAGKTSLIFEPWVAQDISKKYFFRETAKTLGFAALKARIATISAPFDNDYINSHFNLNMLKSVTGRENIYKTYMSKMILAQNNQKFIYKNLGITYMAPDGETIDKIKKICKSYNMPYTLVDPEDLTNSAGLNPFFYTDPIQTATAITTVLKGFYSDRNPEFKNVYQENMSNQIIENLSILLKVAYPILNDGKIPTLNDLLKLLTNFDSIEKMCKILETNPELAKKYENQISYFKQNFYHDSPNLDEMKKLVSLPMAQLDTILRNESVKTILCNRTNNIDFDKALENGEIILVCTRRGDLGETAHKAFGLFFLLSMQFAVLRRKGNENSRVPNFLYIDEFSEFICPAVEPIFTVYRKYRVGTVISAQSLSQMRAKGDKLGNTIIANCANKIVFGNNSPEDNEWWAQEIGGKKDWTIDNNNFDFSKNQYDSKAKASYGNKLVFSAGKLQSLKFKKCAYKLKNAKGKIDNGTANINFVSEEYFKPHPSKQYDFTKFTGDNSINYAHSMSNSNIFSSISGKQKNNSKNPLANKHFDEMLENQENNTQTISQDNINPIQLSSLDFDNDINNGNAIVYNLGQKKNKSKNENNDTNNQ